MLPLRSDVLQAVQRRNWTINDAWSLIETSQRSGFHPLVHVRFPERHVHADSHYLTELDFQNREYRDRGRHSLFRNAWEAAGAVCVALNSEAGEAAVGTLGTNGVGQLQIRSRSALIGAPDLLQRLQLEYQGAVTGVSYFEQAVDHVFLILVDRNGRVGLKTAYPSSAGHQNLPAGKDLVVVGGNRTEYPARS